MSRVKKITLNLTYFFQWPFLVEFPSNDRTIQLVVKHGVGEGVVPGHSCNIMAEWARVILFQAELM